MFDWRQYWLNYEDLRDAGIHSQEALEAHYMYHGQYENRTDSKLVIFEDQQYRENYTDLQSLETFDDLFHHYFYIGYGEKRTFQPLSTPLNFDYFQYYLEWCPEDRKEFQEIYKHLLENPQNKYYCKPTTSTLQLSIPEIIEPENLKNYYLKEETSLVNIQGEEIPFEKKDEEKSIVELYLKSLFFKKRVGEGERKMILLQIGLGDLFNFIMIYKNSSLLKKNLKLIIINKAYLEYKNEHYLCFIQTILKSFEISLPIKVLNFKKNSLFFPNFMICNFTTLLIHSLMEVYEIMPMEDFIILNTKSRCSLEDKESIDHLFHENIQSIIEYATAQHLKIYVLGERCLGHTSEDEYCGFVVLYDKLLPYMSIHPDLWVDKTTEKIINNQGNELEKIKEDLEIFQKARLSVCFGLGGSFVLSCLYCRKVWLLYNPIFNVHNPIQYFLDCFKKKNLTISTTFFPPCPTLLLHPWIKKKKIVFLNWHSTAGKEVHLLIERLGCIVDPQFIVNGYEIDQDGIQFDLDIYDDNLTQDQINYFFNQLSQFDLVIIPNLSLNSKLLEHILCYGTFKILILWWGNEHSFSHLNEYKSKRNIGIPERCNILESFSLPHLQTLDPSIGLLTPLPFHRSLLPLYNSYYPINHKILCIISRLWNTLLWSPILSQITQEQIQEMYFMGKQSHPDDFAKYNLLVDTDECEFNLKDITCMYKRMTECRFLIYLFPFNNMVQYSVLEAIYMGIPVFYLDSCLLSSMIEGEDLGRCQKYSEMFEKIQRCKNMDTLDYLFLFRHQKTCLKYFREEYIQQEWIKSLNIIFQE